MTDIPLMVIELSAPVQVRFDAVGDHDHSLVGTSRLLLLI